MVTEALSVVEPDAPPPRWAAGVSLALIAAIAVALVAALPPQPDDAVAATPAALISSER